MPMTISAWSLDTFRRSRKTRPARELLCDYVFRPLAHPVVLLLLRIGARPPAVVLVHTGLGLASAWLLVDRRFVAAAVLLQAKTILDNADGQLARAANAATAFGRYLDTECDLLVNAVLFAALGARTGRPIAAGLAFAIFTLVLSADYNFEQLHRRARGVESSEPHASGDTRRLAAAELGYRIFFAPQDRVLRLLDSRRIERLLRAAGPAGAARARLAYYDETTSRVLANLGLSTQLAVLGACLLLGRPVLYLWLVLACAPLLVALQLRRERRARRAFERA
jgi:archaetidylinositol phosphate synthase